MLGEVVPLKAARPGTASPSAGRAGLGDSVTLSALELVDDALASLAGAQTTLRLTTTLGLNVPHLAAEGVLCEVEQAFDAMLRARRLL